jgi:hypothetical protein
LHLIQEGEMNIDAGGSAMPSAAHDDRFCFVSAGPVTLPPPLPPKQGVGIRVNGVPPSGNIASHLDSRSAHKKVAGTAFPMPSLYLLVLPRREKWPKPSRRLRNNIAGNGSQHICPDRFRETMKAEVCHGAKLGRVGADQKHLEIGPMPLRELRKRNPVKVDQVHRGDKQIDFAVASNRLDGLPAISCQANAEPAVPQKIGRRAARLIFLSDEENCRRA